MVGWGGGLFVRTHTHEVEGICDPHEKEHGFVLRLVRRLDEKMQRGMVPGGIPGVTYQR